MSSENHNILYLAGEFHRQRCNSALPEVVEGVRLPICLSKLLYVERLPYRPSMVRCSMNCSNPFVEYSTILPMHVTGGPQGSPLLRQLLSVQTLTPKSTMNLTPPGAPGPDSRTWDCPVLLGGSHRGASMRTNRTSWLSISMG